MRSVCVFCGGNPGVRPIYTAAATRLGTALARRGLALVYGGASVGLMGAVADATLAGGGEVFGVLPDFMIKREIAHPGLTRLELVGSMHERKLRMGELSDAFVALPGGFGTLDELFEVLTWAQLGLHQKPMALLDVDGYWTTLVAFLDHAAGEGLLRPEHRAMLLVDDDAERLVDRLLTATPPAMPALIKPAQT